MVCSSAQVVYIVFQTHKGLFHFPKNAFVDFQADTNYHR